MELTKVLEAVQELNDYISEKHEGGSAQAVEFSSDGNMCAVRFCGSTVWNEDEDDRNFDDNANEYEPLVPFLKKKINEQIDDLQLQKFADAPGMSGLAI